MPPVLPFNYQEVLGSNPSESNSIFHVRKNCQFFPSVQWWMWYLAKLVLFSPNQKSGICIIERWLQIGRKPFKGISVALHHHFWRQKGERRPTTMFIISGNLENTTSQPSIPTIHLNQFSIPHTEFPEKLV